MSDDVYSADSIQGLHDRAGHLARRLQQIQVATFLRRNGSFNITPVQYAVLISARERPGLDQATLASLIALDKSTLGAVVDKLGERGLLQRVRDAQDQRRYVIKPSPKGRNLLEAMQASVWQSERDLLSPLNEAEQKKLKQLLSKLIDGNKEMSRAPVEDHLPVKPPAKSKRSRPLASPRPKRAA